MCYIVSTLQMLLTIKGGSIPCQCLKKDLSDDKKSVDKTGCNYSRCIENI